ncbi:MAG TPA: CsgE family curli-type amyloid fiber assembly protein [Hymenobacter sp.]|uniref:CsgE family curli-type amyloid fiber assembly protein n=1 Tax=Hymenobacter sp. TaxID=1898978 RepID=UPI002D80FE23|nr:CsgE family curli-type amyloid fiber assembly protein [Hymenobacter sp.]HET9505008.1 CsgE family curli-type amyloid fiber assembly protein [Hymenobacter sp.]
MVARRSLFSPLVGALLGGSLLACASPVASWAQVAPPARHPVPAARPATRPQAVPKASVAPKIIVAPSKKPLPPAQLEEALRLLLRADSTSQHPLRSEAEGLVLDQAISKLGHDFYDLFYSLFEAPNGVADFTIVVSERPARANASLVVLTVNDTELLELPLATRFDQLEETALYAVGIAQDFLTEAQNVSRQLEAGHKAPLETF